MPANPFLRMNAAMQRTFAHHEQIVWFFDGGDPAGYSIKAFFSSVAEAIDDNGFTVMASKPSLTVFIDDIYRIDPSRIGWDEDELLRNEGFDNFTIGAKTYRVESCKNDGYGKLQVNLLENR